MARLYADEDFDLRVVDVLRQLGHDVVTPLQVGRANQGIPDEGVLTFALSEGRIVITFNRTDFKRLHRRGHAHSGIIVCTRDSDPAALAARVDAALASAGAMDGQLFSVVRPHRP
jgi:hypothetical protein